MRHRRGAQSGDISGDEANPVTIPFFALVAAGYEVICFADGAALLSQLRSRVPACIFLEVKMPERSGLDLLKKLRADYDPTDKNSAYSLLHEASEKNEFLTGLIYVEPQKKDFLTLIGLPEEPLVSMPDARLRPGREALAEIMESLR